MKSGVSAWGVMRGKVTRVGGGGVYVRVTKFGKGERGPLLYVRHRVTDPARDTGSGAGPDSHTHSMPTVTVWTLAPRVGDTVVLAPMDGNLDELIVIGVQS